MTSESGLFLFQKRKKCVKPDAESRRVRALRDRPQRLVEPFSSPGAYPAARQTVRMWL
jgi:hypothetical protein